MNFDLRFYIFLYWVVMYGISSIIGYICYKRMNKI